MIKGNKRKESRESLLQSHRSVGVKAREKYSKKGKGDREEKEK
jgi:hypothetical protein